MLLVCTECENFRQRNTSYLADMVIISEVAHSEASSITVSEIKYISKKENTS